MIFFADIYIEIKKQELFISIPRLDKVFSNIWNTLVRARSIDLRPVDDKLSHYYMSLNFFFYSLKKKTKAGIFDRNLT